MTRLRLDLATHLLTAIILVAAPVAKAQTASDFPDLTVKGAAEKILAVTKCEAFGHEIAGIRSALGDQRVVSVRRVSDGRTFWLMFGWDWADWNGQGVPTGEWRFERVASSERDLKPKAPDEWATKTMAEVRRIALAVEAYASDHNVYPDADLSTLWRRVVPRYTRQVPTFDSWAHPLLYRVSADHESYLIASPGADGLYQTPFEQLLPRFNGKGQGWSTNPANDIVFSNGSFLSWYEVEDPTPDPDRPAQELAEALPCTPAAPPASARVPQGGLP